MHRRGRDARRAAVDRAGAKQSRRCRALPGRAARPPAEQFELSLELLRRANDVANVARSLYNLGAVAVKQERLDSARALLGEALDLSDRVDDKEDIAWCLIALAAVAAGTERLRDATVVLGFADALLERIGATIKPFERQLHDATVERLSSAFGRHELDELLATGARMSSTDAVALARSIGP